MLEQRAKWGARATPARQGAITGRVAGSDGQPIAGACVTAVSVGAGRSVTTAAAADGTFRLGGLVAGSYALEYRDCAAAGHYSAAWSGGATTQSAAARVQIAAGQVRHVPVMMLKPANPVAAMAAARASFRRALAAGSRSLSAAAAAKAGQISGKVTGKGKPLGGICVLATAVSESQAYGVVTGKRGTYTVRDVRPARYYVIFAPLGACSSRANWLQQIYKNDNSPYGGKPTAVRVKAGHKTAGINADLRLGGQISGTVTSKSGAKLHGICVSADANVGHGQYVTYQDVTAANGSYHLHSLFPGKYTAHFEIGCRSGSENYAPATHRAVKIGLAQNRTVNQVLATGASISGVVRLTTSKGAPLKGICVDAQNASGSAFGSSATNSNGAYRVIGLTGGNFQVYFTPGCFNNGNYTSVTLTARTTAGKQTSNVDAVLQVGGKISGTITDTHGNPVSGMCIEVDTNNSANVNVSSDTHGVYHVNQLVAGTYQIGFFSGCGNSGSYAPNWYKNQPTESTATPITLATSGRFPTADAVLQPGATITGKVTNTAGNALSRVCVDVATPEDAELGALEASAATNGHGIYTISGLTPGQYLVNFGCGSGQRYAGQWFPGAGDAATAELVSAPAGRTSGINAVLKPAGTISGVVTGRGGHPLAGVCVLAVDTAGTRPAAGGTSGGGAFVGGAGGPFLPTVTGPHGTYRISGLAAGPYQVSFEPCIGSAAYAEQWYKNKNSAQAATTVKVRTGKTTSGIDGRLVAAGTISGRVVNATGKPLHDICVIAVGESQGPIGAAETGKSGSYAIRALASGRYAVEFSPCGNQNLVTVAKQARVTAPHPTTGINATMRPGGSITGTVTASSGQPVSGSCVEVYTKNSAGPIGFGITGFDGNYRATGLAASTTDQVYFGDPLCLLGATDLVPQWYNDQATQAAATPVTVTVGNTTQSIDAVLQAGGQITGTVSGPAGPLGGVCVTAVPQAAGAQRVVAVTGTSGGYTLAALLPGSYKVRFSSGCGATGYATQWYSDATSQTAATPVSVAAGQTQFAVNATLSKSI